MRNLGLSVLIVLALAASSTRYASAQTASTTSNQQQAYDTFNGPSIDPLKWLVVARTDACRDSTNSLECVREIQGGKLRLVVKSYGARDTNEGRQYGISDLVSAKQATKNMSVDIVMKNASLTDCNSTGATSEVHALYKVAFFNAGTTNDPQDNVWAVVIAQTLPWWPGYMSVYATYYSRTGWTAGQGTPLNVPVGTPVRGAIAWDRDHNKFVGTLTNLQSGQVTVMDVPYTEPVVSPSGDWATPILQVTAIPSNCMASPTAAGVEATFDNVYIDR